MTSQFDWQHWNGGACPVASDRLVVVRRRYADETTGRAGDLRWSHDMYRDYGADDIVAFRLLPFP
jgi:hypothetical protein